jgi:hypothetical protein
MMPYSTAYENLGLGFFVRSFFLSFLFFLMNQKTVLLEKLKENNNGPECAPDFSTVQGNPKLKC